MLQKKFYIPIGALIIAICAVGLFSLRSDTPKEPIKIYKVTTPAKVSTTPAETPTETAKRESTNGHQDSRAIETSAQVESRQGEDWEKLQDTRNASESIAFGGETESQTPEPPSEEYLAEQRYNIAFAKYSKAFQEYHKQFQAFQVERAELSQELEEIRKLRSKASTMSNAELDEVLNRLEKWREQKSDLQKREADWKKERPTPPVRN